jgi:hypothetical protein
MSPQFVNSQQYDSLVTSLGKGSSAIAGISTMFGGHAVVVDAIENGMVYIRDPLGSAYSVSEAVFQAQWKFGALVP